MDGRYSISQYSGAAATVMVATETKTGKALVEATLYSDGNWGVGILGEHNSPDFYGVKWIIAYDKVGAIKNINTLVKNIFDYWDSKSSDYEDSISAMKGLDILADQGQEALRKYA